MRHWLLVVTLMLVTQVRVAAQMPERWDIPIQMDKYGQLLVKPNPGSVLRIRLSDPPVPAEPNPAARLRVAQPLIDLAIADICARYHVRLEDVELWSVVPVTFRDSSLGKPEPGKVYLQVMISGFQINLHVGDMVYRYHGADGRIVFIGPAGLDVAPRVPQPRAF